MTLHYSLSISGRIEHLETLVLYFLLFFSRRISPPHFKRNVDKRVKDAHNILLQIYKMEIEIRESSKIDKMAKCES